MDAPTPESYWVEPGTLLAGTYPGPLDGRRGNARLISLLAAGVTLFVDLTQESELQPYAQRLGMDARHVRMAIPDMGITTVEQMRRTLDLIDRERARGGTTYVHCWGGAGRTGTVRRVLARPAGPRRRGCAPADCGSALRYARALARLPADPGAARNGSRLG